MKKKKGDSFIKIVLELMLMIPNIISFVRKTIALISLEARLAGRALFIIALLTIISGSLLAISWICLLGLLLLYFISIKFTVAGALGMVLLINTLTLVIIGLSIVKVKKSLSFPATRRKCQSICKCGE